MGSEEMPTGVGCFVGAGVLALLGCSCLLMGLPATLRGESGWDERQDERIAQGGEQLSDGTRAQAGEHISSGNYWVSTGNGPLEVIFGVVLVGLAVFSLIGGLQDRKRLREGTRPSGGRRPPQ